MVSRVVKEKIVILKAGKLAKQEGYSLIVVMIAIVIMGIVAESAITLDSYRIKKNKEAELLFRGVAYQNAILSYLNAGVPSRRNYPKRLEHLLSDPRFAHRRHIRLLYSDPMIANINKESDLNDHWRILRNEKGGIVGIASKSKAIPLKKAFFPANLSHFSEAKNYSDWVFNVN